MAITCFVLIRGLVKLKKNQKSDKNSDWSDKTHPPPYRYFFYFFETFGNMKMIVLDRVGHRSILIDYLNYFVI